MCQFLRWQRGFGIPSSAAFGKIGEACVAEVHPHGCSTGSADLLMTEPAGLPAMLVTMSTSAAASPPGGR